MLFILSYFPVQFLGIVYNEGLEYARQGHIKHARTLFAAVVYWCPNDIEARNALALACFTDGDYPQAQQQWNIVLSQSSQDKTALRGVQAIEKALDTIHITRKKTSPKNVSEKSFALASQHLQ